MDIVLQLLEYHPAQPSDYSRLEWRLRPIIEPQIQEDQCGFHPSYIIVGQLITIVELLPTGHLVRACPPGILWGVLWKGAASYLVIV